MPSAQWATCKTWEQAIKLWDLARQSGTIFLQREQLWDTSALTRRLATRAPASQSHLETPTATSNLVSQNPAPPAQLPISGIPTPLLSISKKQLPLIIEISDSDSDGEIEATYPKKVVKVYDCFDLTDDEDGRPYLRKTYDAATNTRLDAPAKADAASRASSSGRCKIQLAPAVVISSRGHNFLGPTPRQSAQNRTESPPTSIQSAKQITSKIACAANKTGKS